MSLPEHVFRAIEDVVGPENVSDDDVITHTYSYMWLVDTYRLGLCCFLPAFQLNRIL
jgi:hypothetical protein